MASQCCSPTTTMNVPEMHFYRNEQYQEIVTLAGDPYTQIQIMNMVVHILTQMQVFPPKEFDTWEQTAAKTYPGLKTFFHEAYIRCLCCRPIICRTVQRFFWRA
jgi:hypothetical protein